MPNHLETIRAACIEANPEIMELKFGCEVDAVKGVKTFFVGRNDIEDENYFIDIDQVGSEDTQFSCEGNCSSKILGRPIRLADVLLAIKERYKNTTGFFMNQYGMFYQMIDELKNPDSTDSLLVKYKTLGWNLRQDDLSLQSPECLAFLADLLGKK